ncbi:unnamed protein product [Caenorhabditis brenneri]
MKTMLYLIFFVLFVRVFASCGPDCSCGDLRQLEINGTLNAPYSEGPGCTRSITCAKRWQTHVAFYWDDSEIDRPSDARDDYGTADTNNSQNSLNQSSTDIFALFEMICENQTWFITKYPFGVSYYNSDDVSVSIRESLDGKKSEIFDFACQP